MCLKEARGEIKALRLQGQSTAVKLLGVLCSTSMGMISDNIIGKNSNDGKCKRATDILGAPGILLDFHITSIPSCLPSI